MSGTIGEGGFGKARKVWNGSLRRWEVEKIAHGDNFQVLLSEARIQAQFDHPNIVRVYGINETPPLIRMEYCEGGSLEEHLQDTRSSLRTPEQAIAVLRDVCYALSAIHEVGIVHSDLGPHNIFMKGDTAKIGDFGIADAPRSILTRLHQPHLEARGHAHHPVWRPPEWSKEAPYDIYTLGQTILCFFLPHYPTEYFGLQEKDVAEAESLPADLATVLRAMLSPKQASRPTAMAILHWLSTRSPQQRDGALKGSTASSFEGVSLTTGAGSIDRIRWLRVSGSRGKVNLAMSWFGHRGVPLGDDNGVPYLDIQGRASGFLSIFKEFRALGGLLPDPIVRWLEGETAVPSQRSRRGGGVSPEVLTDALLAAFNKDDLLDIAVNHLEDEDVRTSWRKQRIAEEIAQYPLKEVLSSLTVALLRDWLYARELPISGRKDDLVARLRADITG